MLHSKVCPVSLLSPDISEERKGPLQGKEFFQVKTPPNMSLQMTTVEEPYNSMLFIMLCYKSRKTQNYTLFSYNILILSFFTRQLTIKSEVSCTLIPLHFNTVASFLLHWIKSLVKPVLRGDDEF